MELEKRVVELEKDFQLIKYDLSQTRELQIQRVQELSKKIEKLDNHLISHMADEESSQAGLMNELDKINKKVGIIWFVGTAIGALAMAVATQWILKFVG